MRYYKLLTSILAGSILLLTVINSANARSVVSYRGITKGAIVINTSRRQLYLGLGNGRAVRYSVGVGRAGKQWSGKKWIRSKNIKPAWRPTAQILRDKPNMAKVIPGGSPRNPMGAAALVLSGDGQYAIHGTNNPGSIGGFVSYGCIRMFNEDIKHLYARVRVGTIVTVRR